MLLEMKPSRAKVSSSLTSSLALASKTTNLELLIVKLALITSSQIYFLGWYVSKKENQKIKHTFCLHHTQHSHGLESDENVYRLCIYV